MGSKRKKIYRAGQKTKTPAEGGIVKGRLEGRLSKSNAGKTHVVKGRSVNHNRSRW